MIELGVSRQKIALTVLALGNVLVSLLLSIGPILTLQILYDPEPQDVALVPWAEFACWTQLVVLAGILASSFGAVFGHRFSRVLLLWLLTIYSLAAIWESVAFGTWFWTSGHTITDMKWIGFWNASIGPRFVLWLGINALVLHKFETHLATEVC
jgi:hypothetical protein